MPSTYTGSGIELIADGEQSGTWGQTTNTNLQIINRMTSEFGTIALSGTTHTLTISDGTLSDGQYGVLVFNGSPSGTNTVTISPNDAKRIFMVENTSGQTVILTQGSGGNVSILNGDGAIVYCNGDGASAAVLDIGSTLLTTNNLVVANNLSDLANATTARTNLGLGTIATLNTVTLGTDTTGNYVATNVAGAGIDVSGATGNVTISIEADLRGDVTHVGPDTTDYITWTDNSYTSFFVNNAERVRIESDGDLHADGDVIAFSTTISDPRLKSDISKIDDALAKLMQINGYTFTYINDGVKSAGVLSTEIAAVLPSAIKPKKLPLKTGDDETVYDTVQYDQIHGLLIEAIKEQQAQIEALKAEVSALKG
jgi:hypothetical protein